MPFPKTYRRIAGDFAAVSVYLESRRRCGLLHAAVYPASGRLRPSCVIVAHRNGRLCALLWELRLPAGVQARDVFVGLLLPEGIPKYVKHKRVDPSSELVSTAQEFVRHAGLAGLLKRLKSFSKCWMPK